MQPIRLTIYGQPASKANSRQLVQIAGKPRVIKSAEARAFMEDARRQIPPGCRVRLAGPVRVTLHLYYATERPDLDESVVLDAMQDVTKGWRDRNGVRTQVLVQAGVYRNDRQVREKHVYHHIDAAAPRAEVEVETLDGQRSLPL